MKKIYLAFLLIFLIFFFSCAGEKKEEDISAKAEVTKPTSVEAEPITICSFNIQFLGHYKKRDDAALSKILKDYDFVVVQELIAPPYSGTFPDATAFNPDAESADFFDEMKSLGFRYSLSEEDTGTNDEIHKNNTSTEWWVCFFKPDKLKEASDLPSGFLADDRSNHDDYERVPYAFAFRTTDDKFDFVLISVHLMPNGAGPKRERRKHELMTIASWIDANDDTEKDFIILGDMNIEEGEELADATPSGFVSLNDECVQTNTNVNSPKPYDHVMFNSTYTSEIDENFDFKVINLIDAMNPFWDQNEGPYPGNPYDHNLFKQYYSDHHPVVFRMIIPEQDDD
jgi:endonuclease/exonuclease/phosphatase family metal-dependent hydrolase